MTTVEDSPARVFENNDEKPVGHGRMLRKEDPRFIRGLGRYCDDVQLPGMLHLAILRSPVAHAKILSIDTSAAEAHPKVKAVVTGETLAGLGLAWMPTLSNDVQAVLATDKVRFQGQEVAFVVAEDRYSARDALELIDVEYEMLDPVIDVRKALDPSAPVIRDRPGGQDRQPLLRLGDRRQGRHRRRVRPRRRRRQPGRRVPAGAPGADGDVRLGGRLRPRRQPAHPLVDVAGTPRAPHPLRDRRRACPSTRSA